MKIIVYNSYKAKINWNQQLDVVNCTNSLFINTFMYLDMQTDRQG
jgi:hypothetical protein